MRTQEKTGHRMMRRACSLLLVLAVALLCLPMGTVQAETTTAKVLIWTTKESPVEKGGSYPAFSGLLNDFFNNNKTAIAGFAGVSDVEVTLQGNRNATRHFKTNEDLSAYDMVILFMPCVALNDNDVKVLQNFLETGGRLVMHGEWNSHCKTANIEMSRVAGLLGATFTITDTDNNQNNAYYSINTSSEVIGGTALNNLYRNCFADISYWGYAEKIAYVDNLTAMVDLPCGKGRITAISDMDWWYNTSGNKQTAGSDMWGRLLKNAIANKKKVQEGGNPNHVHTWEYSASDNVITATCTCAQGTDKCDFSALPAGDAGRKVTLSISENKKAYNAIACKTTVTKDNKFPALLTESDVVYYTADGTTKTTAANSGATAEGKAPVNAGQYIATITYGGKTAKCNITISPKALTVTSTTADNKVYDGTTNATVTAGRLSGVEFGDVIRIDTATGTFKDKNVSAGPVEVEVTYTLSGTCAANYTVQNSSTSAYITAKPINVTAEAKTSSAGAELAPLTVGGDALCAGDSFSGALATDADKNLVGTYSITQGTLSAGDNYVITFTPGVYTVTEPIAPDTGDASAPLLYLALMSAAVMIYLASKKTLKA